MSKLYEQELSCVRQFTGLTYPLQVVPRGWVEKFLAHVVIKTFPHVGVAEKGVSIQLIGQLQVEQPGATTLNGGVVVAFWLMITMNNERFQGLQTL